MCMGWDNASLLSREPRGDVAACNQHCTLSEAVAEMGDEVYCAERVPEEEDGGIRLARREDCDQREFCKS